MDLYNPEPPPLTEPPPAFAAALHTSPDSPYLKEPPLSPEQSDNVTLLPIEDTQIHSDITIDNTPRSDVTIPDILSEEKPLQNDSIKKRLDDIKNQCLIFISELANCTSNPDEIVKKHINMLNQYQELKHIALGLITMIAEQRNIKMVDILEEMKHDNE